MVYDLRLLEVRSCKKLVSGKSGIMCFEALSKENLEIIWESCKYENYALLSLEQDWKNLVNFL